eukprot:scaffold136797_cov32-Tisochrysis_lutea.AAC.1
MPVHGASVKSAAGNCCSRRPARSSTALGAAGRHTVPAVARAGHCEVCHPRFPGGARGPSQEGRGSLRAVQPAERPRAALLRRAPRYGARSAGRAARHRP